MVKVASESCACITNMNLDLVPIFTNTSHLTPYKHDALIIILMS